MVVQLVVKVLVAGELTHDAMDRTIVRFGHGYPIFTDGLLVGQELFGRGSELGVLHYEEHRPIILVSLNHVPQFQPPHSLLLQVRGDAKACGDCAHRRFVLCQRLIALGAHPNLDIVQLATIEWAPIALDTHPQITSDVEEGATSISLRQPPVAFGSLIPQLPTGSPRYAVHRLPSDGGPNPFTERHNVLLSAPAPDLGIHQLG